MAQFGLSSEGDDLTTRMNNFPIELGQRRNNQSNIDNGSQPMEKGSVVSTMPSQQVGCSISVNSSSHNANLDALTRQIMIAGMTALGINNHTLQRQFGIGESTASGSNLIVDQNNFTTPSMPGSSVTSSVPDGSGLLRYRAPEIESFVFDRHTGYRFDPTTGLHYDANTGFFINVSLKIFMRWDPISSTYVRENKCSNPPQSVAPIPMSFAPPVLNSQLLIPDAQPSPASLLSGDFFQTLTANGGGNALLGAQPFLNLMAKSVSDGNAERQTPADIPILPIGLQKIPLFNELWQQMQLPRKEGADSKEGRCENQTSDPKKDTKEENDSDVPKRTSRNRSSSRSRSPSRSLADVSCRVSKSRSRSCSRKMRSVSRDRRKSKNHSRDGRKRRRSRYGRADGKSRSYRSHSRDNRNSRRSRSHSSDDRSSRSSRSNSSDDSSSMTSRSNSREAGKRRRSKSIRRRSLSQERRSQSRGRWENYPQFRDSNRDRDRADASSSSPRKNYHLLNAGSMKAAGMNSFKNTLKSHIRCYKCGQLGHSISKCSVKGILCYGCLKLCDHKRANCPAPKTRDPRGSRIQPGFNASITQPLEASWVSPDQQQANIGGTQSGDRSNPNASQGNYNLCSNYRKSGQGGPR